MKIFLDDLRPTPPGWTRCYWPEQVIELLKANWDDVTEISLDHDLGEDPRNGYDVILWIEEAVFTGKVKGHMVPAIWVHSANPSAMQKMVAGIRSIYARTNLDEPQE